MEKTNEIKITSVDYTIFILALTISALVGLYFGFVKKKVNTVDEYMFGGRNMPLMPVVFSNIASAISTIASLLISREGYYYGAEMYMIPIGELLVGIIGCFFIVPVLHNLKFFSLYQYLERRFNRNLRIITSCVCTVMQIIYMLIVAFITGKSIAKVFSIPYHLFTPIACLFCTLYTVFGGLRGVIWVDAIQFVLMVLSILSFIIFGIYDVGGINKFIEKCNEGGRFDINLFNFNPFVRYSPISNLLAQLIIAPTISFLNQGMMQRFLSLSSCEKAKTAALLSGIGVFFLIGLPITLGLVIYASYADCDPGLSQQLKDTNQLITYYVMDKSKYLPGFSGLFLAGNLATAFSTISTLLNSVSGNIYEDIIKAALPHQLNQHQINQLLKSIVGIIGLMLSIAVFIIRDIGAIFQLNRIVMSTINSLILFVFTSGMVHRKANSLSTTLGVLISLCITLWLGLGIQSATSSGQIIYNTKVLSIAECPENITLKLDSNLTTIGYRGSVPVTFAEDLPYPYRISFQYIGPIGLTVGLITSYIVTLIRPNTKKVDEELLIPQLRGKVFKCVDAVSNEQEMQQLTEHKCKD